MIKDFQQKMSLFEFLILLCLAGYETDPWYLGAVIGRVANRIAGGEFTIDGQTYKVTINDIRGKNNSVHGGKKGFNKV